MILFSDVDDTMDVTIVYDDNKDDNDNDNDETLEVTANGISDDDNIHGNQDDDDSQVHNARLEDSDLQQVCLTCLSCLTSITCLFI
jgi:hypothetical protein